MDDLKLFDLYNRSNEKKKGDFWKNVDASLQVEHNFEKNIIDDKWLLMMEETVRYLDNILRNPNRFIINEEEIVKIELARRITVDSIKHLSKNTNFIQDIDEESGDVKPSKILNINKEESFNTYENRFIYSLIKNMRIYIDMKKRDMDLDAHDKSDKIMNYEGKTKVGKENVNINLSFRSTLNKSDNENSLAKRIERLELRISDLMNTDVYRTIDKLRISLVNSPIKKTNLILKNTNFQYAVKLWNFIQESLKDETKVEAGKDVLKDDETLKSFMDEIFMLNYFVVNTLEKDEPEEEKQKKVSEVLIQNLIQKLILTNKNMTKGDLSKAVSEQYKLIKDQTLATEKEIQEIFKLAINEYNKSISNLKLRSTNAKNKRKSNA